MEEFSMPQSILQIVSEKGFDGLREIMQMLFNEAMKMERENYLHASPYQRTDLRTDHASGFKPCTINTLQGEIQLSIPQTRNGGSDNPVGLKAARMSVFPSVPWQRCQFHLQQNATAHIPKESMQLEVHNDIRDEFNMPTRSDAEIQLKKLIEKYGKTAPELSSWLENELPEGFFLKLWKKGLAEYDDMEGIAWKWQSIDGSMTKAPTAQESVGPNPTDRGKNGTKVY